MHRDRWKGASATGTLYSASYRLVERGVFIAVVLALATCLCWGTSTYFGGVMSRRMGAFSVLIFAQPPAVVLFAPAVVLARGVPPGGLTLLYSIGAGIATIMATASFYRAMTVGRISLVAPIAACGAVLPITVSLILGERPGSLQLWGMPLALIGVALVSIEHETSERKVYLVAGVGFAAITALATGLFTLLFKEASKADPYWAALWLRTTMMCLMSAAAAVHLERRKPLVLPGKNWRWIIAVALVGILGIAGDLLFGAATRRGLLSVVSVIATMYPLVTISLAMIVLKERVVRYQVVGVVSARVGIALLSTTT